MSVCSLTCRLSIYIYRDISVLLFCALMLLSVQTLRIRCHYPLIYYSSRAIIFLRIKSVFSSSFSHNDSVAFDRLHIVIDLCMCKTHAREKANERLHNRSKLNLPSIRFVSSLLQPIRSIIKSSLE